MALRNGNYRKAEVTLRDVLPLQEKEFGSTPNPNIAFTHTALGQLALARKDLRTAEREFEISVEMNSALYGKLDLKTAQSMSNLADVFVREGQYRRAEMTVLPAIHAFAQHPSSLNYNAGVANLHLGEALLGERREKEALAALADANNILRTAPPSFARKLEESRRDLVVAYLGLHEPNKAALYRFDAAKPK